MAVNLSSVVLYGDSQPDFSKLTAKGWEHPLGLHDEPMERSLVKEFKGLRFQIVRHEISRMHRTQRFPAYTEIYAHSSRDDEDTPLLKGHGQPFTTMDLIEAILWLDEELAQ